MSGVFDAALGVANGTGVEELILSSDGYAHNGLAHGRIVAGMQLLEQYSSSPCVFGDSYGFHSDYTWVDKGCRAKFGVTFKQPTTVSVGPPSKDPTVAPVVQPDGSTIFLGAPSPDPIRDPSIPSTDPDEADDVVTRDAVAQAGGPDVTTRFEGLLSSTGGWVLLLALGWWFLVGRKKRRRRRR